LSGREGAGRVDGWIGRVAGCPGRVDGCDGTGLVAG
jgi:hypothetical protein